jgi:periplasmic protein TonB
LKRFARAAALAGVALLALGGGGSAHAAAPCWKQLMNDWYQPPIEKTYPIRCYQEAVDHLPTDAKLYSSAREDILRAMGQAIALQKQAEQQAQTTTAAPTTTEPPPPPPPPPAPKAAVPQKVAPTPPPVTDNKFTAPVETPDQVKPEEGIDLGVEGGVPGGVEGGVPGGVVGGVVGGLPDAPPPPQAVRVGGQIKEPKKLKNVNPTYPDIAKQARVQGVVILECTISPQGKVTDVKVLRGIPLLDAAAIEAVRQWVYSPTLLNGVPVPVIMTVTVNFRLS